MRMEGLFGEPVDRIGGEPIAARMARKAPIRHVDPSLLLITFLLSAYGAVMVYSATFHDLTAAGSDPAFFLKRQIAFAIGGLAFLVFVNLFDYRHLKGLAPVIYAVALMGLAAVLTPLGLMQMGASRWINVGPVQLQPSEITKVAIIVILASYLSRRNGDPLRARDVAACVVMVMLPAGLIYLEPDLGTMMVLVVLAGALLLVARAKIRHFVVLGLLGLIGLFVVFQMGLLQDYQIQRLTSFMDPHPDPRSYGYNLVQSKIAIGSGGMTGKGIQQKNTQTSLDFVPEQHTDFIFTAVGEQLGFVGGATLLGLFALLIWRAIRIAAIARDVFGTLLASGIAAFWAVQVFVNVGMTMGIMPITGIPLPFISYGGSSLMTNYIAVGLLLNIHMRRYLSS
jgi:rod shape determining protein RodA